MNFCGGFPVLPAHLPEINTAFTGTETPVMKSDQTGTPENSHTGPAPLRDPGLFHFDVSVLDKPTSSR